MQIVVDPERNADDAASIRTGPHADNDSKVTSLDGHLGILIKDDGGQTVGGLTAWWYYNWMFVELLFVPDTLRGQDLGTQVMAKAEAYAREHGMIGIWLATFGFQARGFYETLGFKVFGELPNYPDTHSRFFLQKRLDQQSNP